MKKTRVSQKEIESIQNMRRRGYSLPEIMRATGRGSSTVYGYARNVHIDPQYKDVLRIKRGGSRKKARQEWEKARQSAAATLGEITYRDRLLLLIGLYWGEGTKHELSFLNTDPQLIRMYTEALRDIGVPDSDMRVSLRLYEDIQQSSAVRFWSEVTKLSPSHFTGISVLHGRQTGKLKYGMCRIRVVKGQKYFKYIMQLIQNVADQVGPRYSNATHDA